MHLLTTLPLLALASTALAKDYGTCSITSGIKGECIPTTLCAKQGGKPEPNHCPGAADIQCCTYRSCTSSGVKGQCQPVSTCPGHSTTANLCPGPANIQCCTPKGSAKPPPKGGSCAPPAINAATVSLIKEFEGFVKSPAPDPIGLPTVGYGHLCKTKGCGEVAFPFPLTESTAARLLQQDVKVSRRLPPRWLSDADKICRRLRRACPRMSRIASSLMTISTGR